MEVKLEVIEILQIVAAGHWQKMYSTLRSFLACWSL